MGSKESFLLRFSSEKGEKAIVEDQLGQGWISKKKEFERTKRNHMCS